MTIKILLPKQLLSPASAEAAGDVSLRARITGCGEELRRGAELYELTGEQEGREVADARGLLHVVGNGHDGAEILQLHEQLFDLRGADGVERGARLVEKQDFGLDGESARDAQTLLLTAGEFVGGLVEVIFDFVPEGGVAQTLFDGFRDSGFRAVDAQAIGNILENGFGERVGALENHTDTATIGSDVLGKDVLAIKQNFTFEACAADGFVHAVEGAQQGGFAAPRGANERGDLVGGDAHADVEEDLLAAVKEIHFGDGHAQGEG